MIKPRNINRLILRVAVSIFLTAGLVAFTFAQDKTPIIIIPGLTGSELVNSKTGEVVWFKAPRSKDDDLRLPVSANIAKNRDNLVAGDILRSLKVGIFPRIDVYDGLIQALKTKGGYHEEFWNTPSPKGFESSIYVYPYDWRLDNVENARLLIRKIEQLKIKLKQPNLKFNVIAHSMGGIIARYAAMYGDADLPTGSRKPQPTWAGAKYFGKIALLGVPNEGSALSLNSLLNGFAIGGININLPFVQNLTKFDLFSIPSAYQLLPAPGTLRAMDENFEPLNIDIYDPREWSKYDWNAIDAKGFAKQFSPAERRAAPAFLAAMLNRARRLHEALAAAGRSQPPVSIDVVGADCRDSLDSIVLYRETKTGKWKTLFKAAAFTKASGGKVTSDELKKVMLVPGDGVVTKRSLETETQSRLAGIGSVLRPLSSKFICEEHNKLPANAEIQDYVIGLLGGVVQAEKTTSIEGALWQWESEQTPKEKVTVPSGEKYSIEFGAGGKFAAQVDCNRGSGTYKVEGNSITISPLATTKMQCQLGTLAAQFGKSLSGAKTFRIEGNALFIDLLAGAGTMKFTKTEKQIEK